MPHPRRAAKRTASAKKRLRTRRIARAAAADVEAWEDDPMSLPDVTPIERPVPDLARAPLAISIKATAPAPREYASGTPQFRYWTAAEATRRAADFWSGLIGASAWHVGKALPVHLDEGEDLNAYYARGGGGDKAGLSFFHADVLDGRTTTRVFSGESPDVVCHETGHAVLDTLKPELFDANNFETAAFHESFGDMSAILSAVQLPSLRDWITREGARTLYRSSRLSRLAEQLGWAIRKVAPHAVEPDCLRNAVNAFDYKDPMTLPDSAPASALSREPHSFSRVFTGAFYAALSEMCAVVDRTLTADALNTAAADAARLLVTAVRQASIVPQYFGEIAAHMVAAAADGRYGDALTRTFKKRGLMPLAATAHAARSAASRARARRARAGAGAPAPRGLARVALPGAELGLGDTHLLVDIAAGAPSMSGLTVGARPTDGSAAADTRLFVHDLFKHGRVHAPPRAGIGGTALSAVGALRADPLGVCTHVLTREGRDLVLRRRLFD
ncbi:MAG TPA: hypothetical protein VH854_05830 [Thermoanaerobaculia bacterium]|jgi:hypothetical protein|nr:hypothetical protein [Thermoanaerobaculia bacterium]